MIDMKELSILLKWASENLEAIEEIQSADGATRIRFQDGRCGLLYIDENGLPCAAIPAAV